MVEGDQKSKIKNQKYEKKIEKLEERVKELTEKWKRAAADYRNLEKRFEKERKMVVEFANASLVLHFLPLLDDLKEAEKVLHDSGIRLIRKRFSKILEEEGVSEIEAQGKKFDPQTMEATEGSGEKVVEVLQKGYKIRGRVLRPAKVKLGKNG